MSGERKPQPFGALFGAYARNVMVQRVVYVTEEDSFMIDFPVLSLKLSETKKLILKEIQKGIFSVPQTDATAVISKGITYNYLRELKAIGYISDGENGYIMSSSKVRLYPIFPRNEEKLLLLRLWLNNYNKNIKLLFYTQNRKL